MTQDNTARKTAAKALGDIIFPPSVMAGLNWDDLTAAIGAIDDTMDALPGALNGAQSIKTNFIQRLPEPFKSASNVQQKAYALHCWAMKEAGII